MSTDRHHPIRSESGPDSILRAATVEDIPAIVGLERACFSDPWSAQSFADAIGNERILFLVAQSAHGAVQGYVVSWCAADEAELANLAVGLGWRGARIGGAMLDAAVAHARHAGCAVMFLEVREGNAAARALYATRGFSEVGRRRRYYRNPIEDALVLRIMLDESTPGEPPLHEATNRRAPED